MRDYFRINQVYVDGSLKCLPLVLWFRPTVLPDKNINHVKITWLITSFTNTVLSECLPSKREVLADTGEHKVWKIKLYRKWNGDEQLQSNIVYYVLHKCLRGSSEMYTEVSYSKSLFKLTVFAAVTIRQYVQFSSRALTSL